MDMAQRLIFRGKSVGGDGNGGGNFFVEFVFYEREHGTQHGKRGEAQDRDSAGPAATRELSGRTFRNFHDVVDGGISFLLFVDAACGGIRSNNACGPLATSPGLGSAWRVFSS
jgi:hypothetical protein